MTSADWQDTPFIIPLLLIGLICAWVAFVGWRRRTVPGAVPFTVLMAALAGWSLVNLVEKSLVHYELRCAVSTLVYVFIVTVPGAWLVFAVRFARQDRWLPPRAVWLVLIEPILILVLAFTDPWHGLVRTRMELRTDGPFVFMHITHGPFFWVNAIYNWVVFTAGAVFVLVGLARRPDWPPTRLAVVLGAMLVPALGNAAYIFRLQPACYSDLTPVYFAVPALAGAWMLFHIRLFDVRPIARDLIMDCLHDPVIVLDGRARVLDVNPAARLLLPVPSAPLHHRRFADVFPELSRCLPAPVGREECTAELPLRSAGKERFWDIHVLPVLDHGVQIGALVRLTDVTERRRLAEELRQQAERLAQADRRKDEFLALLAHELRNPLAPIRNAVHLLGQAPAGGPVAERAREVLGRQVKHLARLVDDLLDVSRIARGKIRLQKEPLDLARLVQAAVDDRRPSLTAAGLTLDVVLPPKPVWVEGDPTRLAQVVDNLLVNAAKFTDPGGRVAVRLAADPAGGRAQMTVRDTGVGIEAGLVAYLFEPFTQADRGLDRSRGGLGLGLALVRAIIQLHGGEVSAASPGVGKGAEFAFWIPLALAAHPPVAADVATVPPVRPSRRVLVIEDHRDTADMWRVLLKLAGHEVAVAYTGPDGVEAARRFRPEVVLSDVGLPGMDGYAVARALRQDPSTAGAYLIAVTGYGQEEDRRRARAAGFDHHLTKPVDPDELLATLASLSRSR
jgi:signal transduction histidine kinase/CheY-like chemotaxis protein